MKLLLVKIYVCLIKIIYAPMKLRKTKNKVLWLSRQSDKKSLDMRLLEKEIHRLSPETVQVFRLKRLRDEKSLSISYILGLFIDMWHLADSKVVIVDSYSIPVSCLTHKEELSVIQLWHALGAVKKFGLQTVGKKEGRDTGLSRAMHMHENYDYVLAPTRTTGEFLCESFGAPLSCIKTLALPRVDYLLNGKSKREEFLAQNPACVGTKLVAYVPTFRENDSNYARQLINQFSHLDDLSLIVSAHPLSAEHCKNFNGNFSSIDIIKLADVVITDYSACSFEAALLHKPLYFFVPDYEVYKHNQGLNIDMLDEFAPISFIDSDDLVAALATPYDMDLLDRAMKPYIQPDVHNCSEQIAQFVCSLL